MRDFTRFNLIVTNVFVLVLLLGLSADCLAVDRETGLPQDVKGRKWGPANQPDRYSQSLHGNDADLGPVGIRLFDDVIRLIQNHHVSGFPKKHILKDTLNKLIFSVDPLCGEKISNFDECHGNPEDCFAEALSRISRQCRLREQQVTLMALEIILRNLDPYSSILDSRMINELKISAEGKFGGIGMVVDSKNGNYIVVSSIEGSPAHAASISAGDTIISIDGKTLHGLPLTEALGMVRGPSGSLIRLKVMDHLTGKIRNLELKRKTIQAPPVKYAILNHGIGYIRIINFQNTTRVEVEKAMKYLVQRSEGELTGLILDLRDNPGGLFTEAIDVAQLFVKSGVITSLQGKDKRFSRVFRVEKDGPFSGLPIVALINRGSASASEVLTGALLANSNVLVMGEQSFGKASVQNIFPLSPSLALRLTTGHYFTSDGRDIEGRGLTPDIPLIDHQISDRDKTKTVNVGEILRDTEVNMAIERLLSPNFPIELVFSNLF